VLLSIALAFNVIVPVLWVMLVLTTFTVVDRFRRVWQQAARAPQPVHPRRTRTRDDDENGARLRTWWEARRPAREVNRPRPRLVRRTRP
jgi:hypothetical protein